jgi:crotonobetainyl-CoA:carnitine CoA-transferase CaiB-like acyl-CoA transferase
VHAAEENYDIPHYRQRNYWRSIEHAEIGRAIPYPRGPVACDAIGIEPRGRAPRLGEHTRQVLQQDLGLSSQAIASLAAMGAIR